MRGFTWLDGGIDLAAGISEMALQWLVQSTLVIAIGLTAATLLRRGTPALRSVIYRTTLVATLACPFLAYLLSSAGLTFVTIKLPSARIERLELVEATAEPVQPPISQDPLLGGRARELDANNLSALDQPSEPFANGAAIDFGEPSARQDSFPAASVDSQEAADDPPALTASSAPTIERRIVSTYRTLALVFFGVAIVWALVTLGLLGRVVADHLRFARLRRFAVPVDEQTWQVCQAVAERLQVPLPELKRTPFLASPCLSGVFRPVILLPEDNSGESLSPVMVHELAHLKRGDCFWNLLSYLSVAVLWPQPLLWRLVRRIEAAAEDVCDDYVLQFGESRTAYAETLLSLAERNLLPANGAAVSLLTFRSLLGRRIERILDTTRGLRLTVGLVALILVAAGGMSAALVAGMLGPAPEREKSESASTVDTARDDVAVNAKVEPPGNVAENADRNESADDEKLITVRGFVLGPDGRPMNGADVYAAWTLVRNLNGRLTPFETKIVVQGESDDQGHFELTFSTNHPDPSRLTHGWHIAAFAPGCGPAWQTDQQVRQNVDAKQPTTLTLAAEQVVRGRIIDLEGNPVSGVHIRVHNLHRPESSGALLDWLAEAREKSPPANVNDYYNEGTFTTPPAKSRYASAYPAVWRDRFLHHGSPGLPADTLTDEEGKFQLPGLGSDQLAIVEIEGSQIAKCYAYVVVREMEPASAKPFEPMGVLSGIYFGKQFQFVAEPTQPIIGTVADAESGDPLANVEVRISQLSVSRFSQQDFLTTRTDQQGHYTLVGAPSGGEHQVEVNPSPDEPYFPTTQKLAKSTGIDPMQLDFALHRGQWVVGKVTDEDTGGPINDANVEYLPLRDNAFVKDYPNYRPEITGHTPSERYRSSDDGSFQVLAIPGPGILAAIARNDDRKLYCCLTPDLVPPHLVQADGNLNAYHPWTVTGYHALRGVDLAKSADDTAVDLHLTKGLTGTVHLVDTQGQPVTGVQVLGRNAPPSLEGPLDDSTIKIIGLRPNMSREVVFIHADRRIGKAVTITAGDELATTLEPCAAVRGRVVDEDGRSVAELPISVTVDMSVNPRDQWHRPLVGTTTDKEGHFEALLPAETTCRVSHYSNTGSDFSAVCRGRAGAIFELGDLTDKTKLDASQTDKLLVTVADGVKLTDTPTEPTPHADEIETPVTDSSDARSAEHVEFGGKVVDASGQPLPAAQVSLLYYNGLRSVLSAPANTTADGAFLLRVPRDQVETDNATWAAIIVTAAGHGFTLDRAAPFEVSGELLKLLETHQHYDKFVARSQDRTLRFVADDVPISGRVINLEGQGVAGALVRVRTIHSNPSIGLDPWLDGIASGENSRDHLWRYLPESLSRRIAGEAIGHLLPETTTDADGRFKLTGIGRDRLVEILISADNVETRPIYTRTRLGTTLQIPRDRSDPSAGSDICYGPTFDVVAGPSRPVAGTVRDIDTGDPLPGIQVVPEVLAGTRLHSTIANDYFQTTTDAQGAYRITGLPIGTSKIAAVPPRDLPYAPASLPLDVQPELTSNALDFQLKRGVWIRGRVTDAETNEPVRGSINYYIANSNPVRRTAAGAMEVSTHHGWINPDGSYQVVALPGPGLISLLASSEKYPRGVGADAVELVEGSRDGLHRMFSTSPHFVASVNSSYIAQVNPEASADAVELNIPLHAGQTRSGKVLDAEGQPLAGVQCSGLHNTGYWTGLRSADFEVRHLQANLPRRLYFHHLEKQLAGSMELRGDETEPFTVTLVPAGTIKGRLLLEDGLPADRVNLWQSSQANTQNPPGILPISQKLHTDAEGHFQISGLVPGLYYSVNASRGSSSLGSAFENVTITAGETKDLGDLTIAAPEN